MCGQTDDPSQHDTNRGASTSVDRTFEIDHDGVRLYDVEYAVMAQTLTTRRIRVLATDTDNARAKAKSLDPDYLSTTRSPRIVR